MEIIRELENSGRPTSTALGFFDGVHLGHKAVINEAVSYARKNDLVPTVFTLSQSPRSVLTGTNIDEIVTIEEKLRILEKLGVEKVYILDFRDIMKLSAEEFIDKIVVDCFNAHHTVCGFNYHFGSGGSGNRNTLYELCAKRGITVTTQNHVDYNNAPISSTRLRKSIAKGDIISVNSMLGHKYGFCLPVIHGRQLGRKLGTPTLNQRFPKGLVCPSFGVYASQVNIHGKLYSGVTDIGVKPTVGSNEILIETWIPDYIGKDFYGENIDVRFIEHIRSEKKFDNIDSLRNEIIKNGQQAKNIFKKHSQGGF